MDHDTEAGRAAAASLDAAAYKHELDELADLRESGPRSGSAGAAEADPAWREGYPYDKKLSRRSYERSKRMVQIELLKLQVHVKDTGQKVAIVFEGRDAAGKDGSIKRFTEHLNPRGARVVALPVPAERSVSGRTGCSRRSEVLSDATPAGVGVPQPPSLA